MPPGEHSPTRGEKVRGQRCFVTGCTSNSSACPTSFSRGVSNSNSSQERSHSWNSPVWNRHILRLIRPQSLVESAAAIPKVLHCRSSSKYALLESIAHCAGCSTRSFSRFCKPCTALATDPLGSESSGKDVFVALVTNVMRPPRPVMNGLSSLSNIRLDTMVSNE